MPAVQIERREDWIEYDKFRKGTDCVSQPCGHLWVVLHVFEHELLSGMWGTLSKEPPRQTLQSKGLHNVSSRSPLSCLISGYRGTYPDQQLIRGKCR